MKRRKRARASGAGAPASADELHAWLAAEVGVEVPRAALIGGHAAPFDYVTHAFFEPGQGGRTNGTSDCVVWANRGGGKTFLGAVATMLDLVFKPGIEVRILGGSMEQSARMHAHLRRLFKAPTLAEMIEGRVTDRRLALSNGSSVELLAQSQASVRGTRVQKLRCDEVELFHPEVWEAAQLTTRSKRCGGVMVRGAIECLSTMHRPHGLMHTLVGEARAGRRRLFRWGVLDVLAACGDEHRCEGDGEKPGCVLFPECGGRAKHRPGNAEGAALGFVSVDDAARMKGRVSVATWESEMLSLSPRRTDLVLPEFDARRHVVESLPWEGDSSWPVRLTWVGGMDFGFRAPTVVLWGAVEEREDGGVGRLWIVGERAEAGVVLAEHVSGIKASPWPVPEWLGVDPAGRAVNDQTGRSAVSVMRAEGLTVRTKRVRVSEGLGLIRARLRPADGSGPRLLIHRRCATLIKCLETYHYPEDDLESTEPVKDGADHAVDALRYLVQNLDRPERVSWGRYV